MPEKLLVGIQYHRVLSEDKLFCSCSVRNDGTQREILVRYPRLKQTHEFVSRDCYCEYEIDQAPPLLRLKHLRKARGILDYWNFKILGSLVFCRKEILDGSIPKGYQISGMMAYGGTLETDSGLKVPLSEAYLEEDSCAFERPARVDRCGAPLLQITTQKTMMSQKELVQVLRALQAGVSRFRNVPLGAGKARFDINLSSPGRPRVEFKGCDSTDLEGWLFRHYMELEPRPETRKLEYQSRTSFRLRSLSGSQRMKPQSDLPVVPLAASARIRRGLRRRNLLANESKTWKVRAWGQVRYLKRTLSRALESQEKRILEMWACGVNKTGINDYLSDCRSYHALMEGSSQRCMPLSEALELYRNTPTVDFFKRFRLRIPRSFVLWRSKHK